MILSKTFFDFELRSEYWNGNRTSSCDHIALAACRSWVWTSSSNRNQNQYTRVGNLEL